MKEKEFKRVSIGTHLGSGERVQLMDVVTALKREKMEELLSEYDLVQDYWDAVNALAMETNQCFRFSIENDLVERLVKLLAIAWHYAEEEYPKMRDVKDYEGFIECLRTDVYMALYRRVNGFYGFIEPKRSRV